MPIAPLSVSAQSAEELAVIRELGAPRLRDALRLIQNAKKPIVSPHVLRETLATGLDKEPARVLAKQVLALAYFIRHTDNSVVDTVEALSQGLASRWNDAAALQKWQTVAPVFREFLSAGHVVVTAKARDIASDFEHVYVEGRILTDIRPIFDEPRTEIVGAIISHRLRMTYHDANDDHVTLSIAMDLEAVKQLQRACTEALEKASIATALMDKKAGLQIYEGGEDE